MTRGGTNVGAASGDSPRRRTCPRAGLRAKGALLADLVSPLVVKTDGTVVRLAYGVARGHAVGDLYTVRLMALAERWISSGSAERFRALLGRVADLKPG